MARVYTEEQKERKRETNRKWREANREKQGERNKKWYAANKDKKGERNKKWYAANKDKNRERCKKWYAANRAKQRESSKKWYAANKDKCWEHNIGYMYGLIGEQVEAMYEAQGGKCKICGTPKWSPSALDAKKVDKLHIDHCHDTKKVRGLLCSLCNSALGLLKDNIDSLQKAIAYLEEAKVRA